MKAIYQSIIIDRNGTEIDISERISDFTYDRDIEKENFMSLNVNQSYQEKIEDIPVRKGDYLLVQYGYKAAEQSLTHRVKITDLEREYVGTKVRLKIKCRDEGTLMKKTTSVQVWNQVTLSTIAATIAARYGLKFSQAEPTTHVYKSLPQARMDDHSFLKSVAAMEPGGDYIVFIEDSTLYLQKRALDAESLWTIDYGYGSNLNVVRIKVRDNESKSNARSSASKTAVGYDTDKGELIEEVADDSEKTEDGEEGLGVFPKELGDYATEFSGNSDAIAEEQQQQPTAKKGLRAAFMNAKLRSEQEAKAAKEAARIEKEKQNQYGESQLVPMGDKSELRGVASVGKKSGTMRRKELEIEMQGMPQIALNQIITLVGVCPEDEGNWLVKAIKDRVDTKYITTLTCWKNASKKPSKDGQEKVAPNKQNKTIGAEVGTEIATKKLQFFDANGNAL